MDSTLLRNMHFVSSPKQVAIDAEKDLLFFLWEKEKHISKQEIEEEKDKLFSEREKELVWKKYETEFLNETSNEWTSYELALAEEDIDIFLHYGKKTLTAVIQGIPLPVALYI